MLVRHILFALAVGIAAGLFLVPMLPHTAFCCCGGEVLLLLAAAVAGFACPLPFLGGRLPVATGLLIGLTAGAGATVVVWLVLLSTSESTIHEHSRALLEQLRKSTSQAVERGDLEEEQQHQMLEQMEALLSSPETVRKTLLFLLILQALLQAPFAGLAGAFVGSLVRREKEVPPVGEPPDLEQPKDA